MLAPALAVKGVYLYPRIVGKPGHKGGNKFSTVRRELKALIHQEPQSTVTTFFDYFRLFKDWPGLAEAKGKKPDEVPGIIEPAVAKALADEMGTGFNPEQFIPYIQLHEVESLLFAGPYEMAVVFHRPELEEAFAGIVRDCGGCEWINDNPETSPSRRIQNLFPGYKKGSSVNAHAYRIARKIGIEKIRRHCPPFSQWLTKLEQLT